MSPLRDILWPVAILLAVILVLYLSASYSVASFRGQTLGEVSAMYSSSKSLSDRAYDPALIGGLPEPVQRYFKHSLREGRRYISTVRLKHSGYFRPNPSLGWLPIAGEEYFSVERPGYVWYAEIRPNEYVWLAARDRYYDGKGAVLGKLYSGIEVINSKGNETDQGAMVRFLGEAVWFPTFLLPSEKIRWEPLDNNSAKAYFTDAGRTVVAVFHFNELGEVTSFTAERFMGRSLENFEGICGNYTEFSGMKIPTEVEAIWHLPEGDYSYAKFVVTEIEFDNPKPYSAA